jgi:hypothetical protein
MATVPSARAASTRPLACLQHTTSEVKATNNNILKFKTPFFCTGCTTQAWITVLFVFFFKGKHFFSRFFCFNGSPSDSTMPKDAGNEPVTVCGLTEISSISQLSLLDFYCCKFVVFCYSEKILSIFQVANTGN